jgi:hypothetical protein
MRGTTVLAQYARVGELEVLLESTNPVPLIGLWYWR